MWFIFIGFALAGAAAPLRIGSVIFDGQLQSGVDAFDASGAVPGFAKQVGYFAALNWSFFGTFIAPAIIWFGLSTIDAFSTTLRDLCDAGMIRTAAFKKVPHDALRAKWQRHMTRNRSFLVVIVVTVFAVIMYDWWSVVGSPILWPDQVTLPLSDPNMEYDWSVSSIFSGSSVNATALFIFGFFGYVVLAGFVPALAIGVTLCTIYYMFFVTTLRVDDDDDHSQRLQIVAVPSKNTKDRHFGFRAFSGLFHNFLMMSLIVLVGLWFMSVQNFYLRDPISSDLYQFIIGEAGQYRQLSESKVTMDVFFGWFVKPSSFYVANPQIAFSFLLYPFICVVSVLGCWFVLRVKASEARDISSQNAAKLVQEVGGTADDFKDRLEDMEIWPVGWISSQRLLLLMAFMFLSLISFRLIAIPLLVIGVGLGAMAIKLLMPTKRKR